MAEYIKEESTVLVINGVPYSLVHEIKIEHNNVCPLCDLSNICGIFDDRFRLLDLCYPMDSTAKWFFKIDWEILDNKIRDYIDLGSAVSEDKF